MQEKNIHLIMNASEGVLQVVAGEIEYKTEQEKYKKLNIREENTDSIVDNGNRDDKNSLFKQTILVHQEWDCPKNGTEKLASLLQDIFEKLERPLEDIARISCVTGAGSFTGIRLTLCTASALARVVHAKQTSIDFLHALAFNAPLQENTHVRVITHAKRNLVHCADFITKSMQGILEQEVEQDEYSPFCFIPQQVGNTRLISPEQALEDSFLEKETYLLGSGVAKYPHIFNGKSGYRVLNKQANILNPFVLLYLSGMAQAQYTDLNPDYVRSCDAVDNLAHISQKLGNNTEAAFSLYEELIK